MFEIDIDNPAATIAAALKAIGSTKQHELAARLGLSGAAQLSRAKKEGKLPFSLAQRFSELQNTLSTDPVITTEPTAPQEAPVAYSGPIDTMIDIDLLQADDSIQQRVVHLNDDIVSEYAGTACPPDSDAPGWPFPPIVVFRDDQGRHWLADGFHRVAAALRCGIQEIPASIRDGDRDDAIRFAAGANAQHGLRRTLADKRKAVRTLLTHPKFCGLTDRAIAGYCGVHHQMVGTLRAGLSKAVDESSSQIDKPAENSVQREPGLVQREPDHRSVQREPTDPVSVQPAPKPSTVRTTKSGRTIDTAGIAASNKARAKTPPPATPKAAQEALHRFMGACTDLEGIDEHVTPGEALKVAQQASDVLIWCFNKIPYSDAAVICFQVEQAHRGGE